MGTILLLLFIPFGYALTQVDNFFTSLGIHINWGAIGVCLFIVFLIGLFDGLRGSAGVNNQRR